MSFLVRNPPAGPSRGTRDFGFGVDGPPRLHGRGRFGPFAPSPCATLAPRKKGWQSTKQRSKGNPYFCRMPRPARSSPPPLAEVCILAGGRSTRMGRDKGALRLGSRTLLGHARALAAAAGFPCRTIKRDRVPRCGPLGGVITALGTTRARTVIFIPCDMPFLTVSLLRRLRRSAPAFAVQHGLVGFPFALLPAHREVAEGLMERGEKSLQALARCLKATQICLSGKAAMQLANLNSPHDLSRARLHWPAARRPNRKRGGAWA